MLAGHYAALNKILDRVEEKNSASRSSVIAGNGGGFSSPFENEEKTRRISRNLRDDYSALNLITMSNTLLHTAALALNREEVAALALKHLNNLAPLVIKIGELMPDVVARELRTQSIQIDSSVAKTALENTQLAWRNAA